MEQAIDPKSKTQAKILMRKCQNLVQLCEQKEPDGSTFHFVRIDIGKTIFWVSYEEMKEIMFQFGEVIKLRGKKQ